MCLRVCVCVCAREGECVWKCVNISIPYDRPSMPCPAMHMCVCVCEYVCVRARERESVWWVATIGRLLNL